MASFINTWPFSVIPKPLYLSNSASLIKIPIGIFTNEYFPVSSLYTIDKASLLFCIGFLVTSPVFSLNTNYRSSAKILALANKVISNNPRLYPKSLEVSREGEFKSPILLVYDELFIQYNAVAELISNSRYNKNDIAIIFRNNSSADGLEIALKEYGISCKRKGGVSFFESREIKALIDLISILVNPKDIMSFIHIRLKKKI